MKRLKMFLIVGIFLIVSVFVQGNFLHAQEAPTPTPANSKINDLNNQIKELQNKIAELQEQKKTLSSQIAVMNSQIKLTQLRINATEQQLADLKEEIKKTTNKIDTLQEQLEEQTKVLLGRIVATYQVGRINPLEFLLVSNSVPDFLTRANYLRLVQAHDKKLIFETQQTKVDYSNQKEIFEEKEKKVEALKKQLEAYTAQINEEKKAKQTLLDVTRNDEERYQKLLAEAQAQIRAFKSFATTQGGPSILPPQPSPDGWYYNQRDERWGRNIISSSGEQVWDVGCLVTSVAMVMKQKGSGISPAEVAANSSYFFSDTAYMLLPWAGGKFSSAWGFDSSSVDSKLSGGEPVIVGLKAGAYGMHFVVLKSGSNGDYIMNDPWNGPNLKFTDYYSTGQIFQYGFYSG